MRKESPARPARVVITPRPQQTSASHDARPPAGPPARGPETGRHQLPTAVVRSAEAIDLRSRRRDLRSQALPASRPANSSKTSRPRATETDRVGCRRRSGPVRHGGKFRVRWARPEARPPRASSGIRSSGSGRQASRNGGARSILIFCGGEMDGGDLQADAHGWTVVAR